MTLKFGTSELLESARENFVGRIASAVYPCNCEDCKKGVKALEDMGQPAGEDRLHIQMKPLTVYTETQHEWLVPRKTIKSKWGAYNLKLEELGVEIKSEDDLVDKVFEYESSVVKVGVRDSIAVCWLPIRVVSDKEAAKLEAERESEEVIV